MEKLKQKLLKFIEGHPNCTKVDIAKATGVKSIQLYNLLRKLKSEEKITEEDDGADKRYTILIAESSEDDNTETEAETEETEEVETVTSSTRDNSKFKFNGELYGKGPLVRAVVAQYVTDNPRTTYKQLKEAFPDELLKRFGIFQDEATAKEIAPKGKRYFDKPDQVIKLKDRKIVVCNQFTLANIQPFLKAAKALGYKIK